MNNNDEYKYRYINWELSKSINEIMGHLGIVTVLPKSPTRPQYPFFDDGAKYVKEYKYLKKLQLRTYQTLGISPLKYDEDLLKHFRSQLTKSDEVFNEVFGDLPDVEKSKYYKEWQSLLSKASPDQVYDELRLMMQFIPTPYEDPYYYYHLQQLQYEIEGVILREKILDPDSINYVRPIVGTLPTGDVNAQALSVPKSSKYLLLFDSQVFNFINLLCKPLAKAMPRTVLEGTPPYSMEPSDVFEVIDQEPDIAKRFAEALCTYVESGYLTVLAPYALPEDYAILASKFITATELFMMAHEYGHIIKGHLDKSKIKKRKQHGIAVNEFERSVKEEYEADIFGLQLSSRVLQEQGWSLIESVTGALLFFGLTRFAERGFTVLEKGEDISYMESLIHFEQYYSTHPPALARLATVGQYLEANFPEQINLIWEYKEQLFGTIEILWRSLARSVLLDLHKEGIRPSSRWIRLAQEMNATISPY